MLLRSVIEFAVKPVDGKPNWFEICGRPLMGLREEMGEIIDDAGEGGWFPGAKIVGIYDNEEVLADDYRFSYESKLGHVCDRDGEPGVLVTKDGAGFMGFMYVNTPESVLFQYASDLDNPEIANKFPVYMAGSREREDAYIKARLGEKRPAAKSAPKTKALAKSKAKAKVKA